MFSMMSFFQKLFSLAAASCNNNKKRESFSNMTATTARENDYRVVHRDKLIRESILNLVEVWSYVLRVV